MRSHAPLLLALCAGCLVDNPLYDGGTGTGTGTAASASSASASASGTTTSASSSTAGSATAGTSATTSASTSATTSIPDDWWDPEWACRRRLSVQNPVPAETFTDFPVMLRLTPQNFDYAGADADGADLRFVADDNATLLDHEIERWSPGNPSTIWVRLPSLPPEGAAFSIYWCGQGPAPEGAGVWSGGFEAVYHLADPLDDGPEPTVRDSTGVHDGRGVGGMGPSKRVPSARGHAFDFDGLAGDMVGDYIDLDRGPPIESDLWDAITVEAWALQRQRGEMRILCKSPSIAVSDHVFAIGLHDFAPVDRPYARIGVDAGVGVELQAPGPVPLDVWFHVALTWSSAGTATLYLNGEPGNPLGVIGATLADHTIPPALANINDLGVDPRFWIGQLDEVRIHRVARSHAWIKAQIAAMSDLVVDYGAADEKL